MSAFPGAGAQVYYNEAGEPLGWDYPAEAEPYSDADEAWNEPEVPFKCECGATFYPDDDDDVLYHHEVCETPESLKKAFPDIDWSDL